MGLLAILLAGCSASDDGQQQLKTAVGSAATAEMAMDAWLVGDLPSHYARRTIQAMREQVAKGSDLGHADGLSAAQQATVPALMQRTGDALRQGQAAIDASDRPAGKRAGQEIGAAASAISALVSQRAATEP